MTLDHGAGDTGGQGGAVVAMLCTETCGGLLLLLHGELLWTPEAKSEHSYVRGLVIFLHESEMQTGFEPAFFFLTRTHANEQPCVY